MKKDIEDLLIRINLLNEEHINEDVQWNIIDTLNKHLEQLFLCGVGSVCCDKTIKHNELLKDEFKDDYCNWCNRKIV